MSNPKRLTIAFSFVILNQLMTPWQVFAEETTSSTLQSKSSVSSILKNKEFQDSNTLTDTRLRAEDGSLSRYSLKLNLSYYGPTLNDFGAKDQPNIDGTPGNYRTALGGSFGFKIRTSSDRSFSLSTGLKATYPFHGMERTDINDPTLSYEMSSRLGDLQMRNIPSVSYVTTPNYKDIGEFASAEFKNSLVNKIGESNFAAGFDTTIAYFFYERGYTKKDGKAARNNISFSPNLKYNINDKININTSLNFSFWNPRQFADQSIFWNRTVSQSLGLGYAIKRDIYLSPYLRFYPNKLAVDATTFNFSTILSIF